MTIFREIHSCLPQPVAPHIRGEASHWDRRGAGRAPNADLPRAGRATAPHLPEGSVLSPVRPYQPDSRREVGRRDSLRRRARYLDHVAYEALELVLQGPRLRSRRQDDPLAEATARRRSLAFRESSRALRVR